MIRVGFWGPLYYSYNKEPPKYVVQVIIQAPILIAGKSGGWHAISTKYAARTGDALYCLLKRNCNPEQKA